MSPRRTLTESNGTSIISVPEAARRLGISPWTYYYRIKQEAVPYIRLGRSIYVPVAKLERFLGP